MTINFRRAALHGLAVMTLSSFAVSALAQTPAPVATAAGEQGDNIGPGIMNGFGSTYGAGMMGGSGGGFGSGMMGGGGPGDGRGMMNGFGPVHPRGGDGKTAFMGRSEALKEELKITADESPAWKTYTDSVTASDQIFFAAMKTAFDPNSEAMVTPDDRFALMTKMITLRKQNFDVQKTAAELLVTKLTPYQSGQAHEILPGLAQSGGFGGDHGMGTAMMNFDE